MAKKPNPFAKGDKGKCPDCGKSMDKCGCKPSGKGKFPPKGKSKK